MAVRVVSPAMKLVVFSNKLNGQAWIFKVPTAKDDLLANGYSGRPHVHVQSTTK